MVKELGHTVVTWKIPIPSIVKIPITFLIDKKKKKKKGKKQNKINHMSFVKNSYRKTRTVSRTQFQALFWPELHCILKPGKENIL